MKSVLISIRPEWIVKILNGEKTIEIRKTMPKLDLSFKVYIYETKAKVLVGDHFERVNTIYCGGKATYRIKKDYYYGQGKVVAEFTLNKVGMIKYFSNGRATPIWFELDKTCLTNEQIKNYLQGKVGYAWRIDNLKIYDTPKELSDFYKQGTYSYEDWLYGYYNGHRGARNNYNSYLNICRIKRPPQSWCYVEELK